MSPHSQRSFISFTLFAIGFTITSVLPSCDKPAPTLSPEQSQQAATARQSTIDTTEHLLRRPLTDAEKDCIHINFHDDRPFAQIAPPLSETLKQRQAELFKGIGVSPTSPGKN